MDIIPAPKKNIVLDASMFTSIMSCGRKTDLQYNRNFRPLGGSANSLETGSLVHKMLETYYKTIIGGVTRSEAIGYAMTAGELYIRGCRDCATFQASDEIPKPVCGHKPEEYPGLHQTPPDSTTKPNRTGWRDVMETMELYFNFWKNDHWVPLEVEVVKSEILYQDDEIRVLWKAKLDLIADTNQGIFPTDHKTMKQRRDTLTLNNQFTGQCLLMKTRQVFINKIGYQKTLKSAERFLRTPMSFSIDRLIEWQSEILPFWAYQYLQYHETETWPPNFTNCESKYGNCIFHKVCESDRHMREEELKINFRIGEKWNPTNDED